MLHIANIPHVLEHGITHKDSENANPNFVAIGDISLISTRADRVVTIDNGNPDRPAKKLALGDCIPFYFGVRMPMLYVIQNGGNWVLNATHAQDIVYVACSVNAIVKAGLRYYFSDGHATDYLTTFYNKQSIADLPNLIDWKAVKTPYWGGEENLIIKRKKQAEFLVRGDIPTTCISGFACFNAKAKARLQSFGIEPDSIKVTPNAYY